tara:strand:+ start:148 stop:321 length:174 start_codon:yes stop_codon:yes gene_type:complete
MQELTHPDFWDCECDEDYIKLKSETRHCIWCGAEEDDMPDSMIDEALNFMLRRYKGL